MNGLILLPTQLEQDIVEPQIQAAAEEFGWSIERCGFGPIAAASRSASLLARLKPKHVLLLGIAGTFVGTLPVGTATAFGRVCCYGVGVGHGNDYQSAGKLGFEHCSHDGASIGDCLDLSALTDDSTQPRVLLTTPAASANKLEAAEKLKTIPDAVAEDMEGFSVAVSCLMARVPLTIIRGISNEVGDRNRDGWQIDAALGAAAKLAIGNVLQRPLV